MQSTSTGTPSASRTARRSRSRREERAGHLRGGLGEGRPAVPRQLPRLLLDQAANDTAAEFIKAKIRAIVKDPATAEMLADIDHPYAAKRPPIDTDYFETFNRDNVSLVDVRADPIEAHHAGAACRRAAREYPLDIIVFATGFDAMTGPLLRMDIRGRDGVALKDAWEAGPAHLSRPAGRGLPEPVHRSPGPGSPSVLSNMPVAIEQHVEWITDCIAHMRERGLERIEPTADGGGRLGAARSTRPPTQTLLPHAPSTPGISAPTCRASRACSCPTPAAWRPTARSAPTSPPAGYEGFVLR